MNNPYSTTPTFDAAAIAQWTAANQRGIEINRDRPEREVRREKSRRGYETRIRRYGRGIG